MLPSRGARRRPNAICPRCHSKERHRLLWLYLDESTNLSSTNLKLLHFAPEWIFEKKFRRMKNLDYTTADLDPALAMIQMDITNIEFGDNSFDVILCNHVLEHVPDDRKAMQELYRVLRPGGWAILQVPIIREETFEDPSVTDPKERERVFQHRNHVRAYGKDYIDRLRSAGFEVELDDYAKRIGVENANKYSLLRRQEIYLCRKPCAVH